MRRYYRLNTAWFQSSDEEPADIDLDELDVVLVSDLQKILLPGLRKVCKKQVHRDVLGSKLIAEIETLIGDLS